MSALFADLLLGGARLKDIYCELDQESPKPGSHEWVLSGRIRLSRSQTEQLQADRTYRLQMADGRAGQVVLDCIPSIDESIDVVVPFKPQAST